MQMKDAPTADSIRVVNDAVGLSAAQLVALMAGEPAYFYSRTAIDRRVDELRASLPEGISLAYSLKANPFEPVVCHLRGRLDGADVTSFSELQKALSAGFEPRSIMFAGPAKTEAEHRAAIAMGVCISAESIGELRRISALARAAGRPARVLLRINPEFALSGASMRMGGAPTQFGIDAADLAEVWPLFADEFLDFTGVHIYWGSQCLSEAAIDEANRISAELVFSQAGHFPRPPTILNLGGGFGIPYSDRERALDLGLVGRNLALHHRGLSRAFPDARIFLELGRYLVGEAGVYVTRVIDRKVSHGVDFLVTDGGMHHFLAASGNLGQRIRRNYPLSVLPVGRKVESSAMTEYEVVGALCTPIDLLGHRVTGPDIRPGDLICVHCAGAYGRTASPVDFLSHPHPREYLI